MKFVEEFYYQADSGTLPKPANFEEKYPSESVS